MKSVDVANVREALGMSQAELAQLLDVHPMTVSKWERKILAPTHYQSAFLEIFHEATRREMLVGYRAARLMRENGTIPALFSLLRAGLNDVAAKPARRDRH